jgi:hypothetical protein
MSNTQQTIDNVAVVAASSVAGYNWLTAANDLATLALTLIVGVGAVLAALHKYEAWQSARKENRDVG